ncbi:unnamed protein product, partial [Rotaria magnacalcarata]
FRRDVALRRRRERPDLLLFADVAGSLDALLLPFIERFRLPAGT